jgi:hypothetical protein
MLLSVVSATLLTVSAFGETRPVDSGRTAVTLSSGFVAAVTSLGVGVAAVLPAQAFGTVVSFPITGGIIDLSTARAEVPHSGGLELTAGMTKVQLLNFTIDTTDTPKLTGTVVANGTLLGRVHLFDLQLPSGITLPLQATNELLTIPNTTVRLSATAAEALNALFNVEAFTAGFEIGTAQVSAFLGRRVF